MNGHLKELEERIDYQFKNQNLFSQALTLSLIHIYISQLFSYIHEFEDKREGEQLSLMDFMGG